MVGKPVLFPIIVTYKGQRWYEQCFNSLRQSTVPVQTIVVDNASNDGTVEYIKNNIRRFILLNRKRIWALAVPTTSLCAML
jgi:GT2 family glycosyltransferase